MWVVDELWYLRDLFLKNVRRLLHLLLTTARKTRSEIVALLQKCYNLLFEDTPTKVYKVMVDFNRWLTEVLADTYSEGIERSASYGDHPWLGLEEMPRHGRTTLAFDNTSTIQLLRTACEYYMARCDRLQTTNADLEKQLIELQTRLKEALTRAFDAQETLQQGSSDEPPHQQVTSVNTICKVPRKSTEETSVGESNPVNEVGRDCKVEDVLATSEDTELEVATPDSQEEALPPRSSKDLREGQETFQPSVGQLDSEPAVSSVVMCESISISSDSDYEQLIKLRSDEANNDSWYRHALHTLTEARKRRSKTRATAEPPFVTKFTASAVCKEATAHEFTQLVFARDPVTDGDDSTWHRNALRHLKNERKHHLRLHDRAESFTSTIPIVD